MPSREFDIVIVGASGLTGRLVADQIARHIHPADRSKQAPRWAVTGRDRGRTIAALSGIDGDMPDVLEADLTMAATLPALTRRARVILNVAGPYASTAGNLIAACVETKTDYVDLSGELPLIRDMIARYHEAAEDRHVRIVQMAGWDALPADLTTLLASRRAMADQELEGPGAGGLIETVMVTSRFMHMPRGQTSLSQAVSAGTVTSIAQMLGGPDAWMIGRTDTLLPPDMPVVERPADIRVRTRRSGGRVLAPFLPVPFLNAPIVQRTAALQALSQGVAYRPARYLEGDDVGPATGADAVAAFGKALALTGVQRAIMGLAKVPAPIRRGVGRSLRDLMPKPGSGPTGKFLTDWEWTVRAEARSSNGSVGEATLSGRGHPGYAATAAMMAELGLRLARGRVADRFGCLTPALTLGSFDIDPWFVGSIQLQ